MSAHPEPLPHGRIQQLFSEVFLVQGTVPISPLVTITRNMIVLRDGADLTLVNSVRLSRSGEVDLEQLGAVKHLVKLGHFHKMDDPYYRERYAPTFWSATPTDAHTEKLEGGGASPMKHAQVFKFEKTREGEAALVVEQPQGNLLVTCDSLQNWQNTKGCSLLGGLALRAMGFFVPAKIGPVWLKEMSGGTPAALKPDFDRLLDLDFMHLVSAHGGLLRHEAKAAAARSCAATFPVG